MRLILCRPRGFCAGVTRAIEIVERALLKWGAPIYVRHEIVHNRHVMQALEAKGVIFVNEIADVPEGEKVIYSAHGVAPEVREEAKKRGLTEIDATCILVAKLHEVVKKYARMGYHVILVGKHRHAEIEGVFAEAPDHTTIVASVDEVQGLNFANDQKLIYVTQTTLSLDDVADIALALTKKFPQIESPASICYATHNRQKALIKILEKVGLVLIVGDTKSSNSNRLQEVALRRDVPAYLINDEKEIKAEWFQNISSIGMTAGASTPEAVVQRCINALQSVGVKEIIEEDYILENISFPLPKELQHV